MTENMIRCKLLFRCYADNGHERVEDSGLFSRVLWFKSLGTAQRTAKAMLGEEARYCEFLKEVVSVKETDEEANLMSWTREHTEYIWYRVLNNLGLKPEEVNFFPSEFDKKGLIFKRSPLN